MLEAIANLALILLGAGTVVIWIASLVKWDGKGCNPNEQDCNSCPFPCEKQENKNFGGN